MEYDKNNKLKSNDHCRMTGKKSLAQVPKKGKANMISKTKQVIGHLVTMAFSNRIYEDGEMDIKNATWRRH